MIIYSANKRGFMGDIEAESIAYQIRDMIKEKMHRKTSDPELRSWKNSLQYMYMVLNDNTIPNDAGVAIEYNLPNTAKRIDFLVSGYDAQGKPQVVIIELKQWEELSKVDGVDALVETYTGGGIRRVVHPSYQAWSYASVIEDYNEYAQIEHVGLKPCAYLHNYLRQDKNDPLDDPIYSEYLDAAPAFVSGDTKKLRQYINSAIKYGDNKEILYEIDNGKIKPSKSLQDSIVKMLEGNPEFKLIDDQKVVFERIMELSRLCEKDGRKRVFIAKGGPGTGKTVIAINLLACLTEAGVYAQYCSKNSAPRAVYETKLKGHMRKSNISNMFKGSGAYIDAPENSIGAVLADEAHRLKEKSGLYGNRGENQIMEIIRSARLSVFFIDEHQRVSVDDIGSVDQIRFWAKQNEAEIYEEQLVSQFRCNGSDGYLAWVDDVLEVRETANYTLDNVDYDFVVLDSPQELLDRIKDKNEDSNKARLLAGYCWEWPTATRRDTNAHDIKIGDFGISWNLSDDDTFAISPTSVNEAGCIHTTQGLELEYAGVIIGDDLRYENGQLVTDFTKRAKSDSSIKGLKKMAKEDPEEAHAIADEIIKNTYRVLMTRAMKGCYVYATNEGLQKYLKERAATTVTYDIVSLD